MTTLRIKRYVVPKSVKLLVYVEICFVLSILLFLSLGLVSYLDSYLDGEIWLFVFWFWQIYRLVCWFF